MDPHAIGTESLYPTDRHWYASRYVPHLPLLRDRALPSQRYPALGVGASDHAVLYILATPSEPFFQRPISLLAVSDVVRAWPGGTGGHKFSGNYSPGFLPLRDAVAQGYDQILWLYGEQKWVTEGGAMNVFVVLKQADGSGAYGVPLGFSAASSVHHAT